MEYQKVETIAQAERQAKTIVSKQLRVLKNIVEEVKLILEIPTEANDQNIKQQLLNLVSRSR